MSAAARHISPYRPGDETHILTLYNDVHPIQINFDFWRWQYLTNPAGGPFIELMWEGQKLIGFYSLVPASIFSRGECFPGALSGTAVTHWEYRYQGVFGLIGQSLYERAGKHGIRLIYGFPTSHNRRGLSGRLGWNITDVNLMYCWDAANRIPPEGTLRIKEVKKFDESFNLLWHRLLKGPYGDSTMVVRDAAYLQWRFMDQPGTDFYIFIAERAGHLMGYIVLKKNARPWESTGDIADVAAWDTGVFRELVRHAFYFFRDIGCVRMLLPRHSPYYAEALRAGFKESNISVGFGWRDIIHREVKNKYLWEYGIGETSEL